MRGSMVAVLLAAGLAVWNVTGAQAAVLYGSGAYSESFDSLSQTGSANAWTDDTTLAGWYAMKSKGTSTDNTAGRDTGTWAAVTSYRASGGGDNTGAIYSYGIAGVGLVTDRALGSVGSGTPGDFVYALVLQNNSSTTYQSFRVTYDGEQWRNGGNTTAHVLDFDYRLNATFTAATDLPGNNLSGYSLTGASALDFTGPIATATSGALDGNDTPNRIAGITGLVTNVSWGPGTYLILRWFDNNDASNDHGLGIDNLSFVASEEAPEPATLILLGLGGLVLRRRPCLA